VAGSFAKIFNKIWADPDFRSLTRGQQWLYFALISQPELNFAGVVTTTDRRLTGCAEGFTLDELHNDLAALEACRYIVVDQEHDEILVRSYMRHDGAWRTPNVLTSILRDVIVVRSRAIRATLAEELARLEVDELSGKKADEMRENLARVIETLRPRVPATVGARVSGTVRSYVTEPIRQPIAEPTVVVAVVGEESFPCSSLTLPQDRPTPAESVAPGDGVLIEIPGSKLRKPEPGSDDDPAWVRFWAAYPNKRSKQEARARWAKVVRAGADPELIISGAERYAEEMQRKRIPKDKIKHPDGWLNGKRWEDEEDSSDDTWSWDGIDERAPAEFN
jgi:hypothetical protein